MTKRKFPRSPEPDIVQAKINYSCLKKIAWRQLSIIDCYRCCSGLESIPSDRQYWTMPNKTLDKSFPEAPRLLPDCEFDQVIRAGLAKPDQCHGVERVEEIYRDNARVPSVHAYFGDFAAVMSQEAYKGYYNPAIVVYDAVEYPTTSREYFPHLLLMLTQLSVTGVLAVWNFIIKAHYHAEFDPRSISGILGDSDILAAAIREARRSGKEWHFGPKAFKYNGSGKGHQSKLASVYFYR